MWRVAGASRCANRASASVERVFHCVALGLDLAVPGLIDATFILVATARANVGRAVFGIGFIGGL